MKKRTVVFPIVLLTIMLSACALPATPTVSPTAKSIPKIPLTPETVVLLTERLLATINVDKHPLSTPQLVGNQPDEKVFVSGYIWTGSDNGYLVQTDPATNTITGAVQVELISHPLD